MKAHRRVHSRRAFLKRGLFLGLGASTHLHRRRALAGITADVVFLWVGAVTARSAKANAKLAADGRCRLVVSTRSDLSSPVYSSYATAQKSTNNRVVALQVSGLEPNVQYYCAVAREGAGPDRALIGRFRTFPETAASFSFACASCAATGSNRVVFNTIEDRQPLFFIHMGDLHYEDIAVNDRNVFRSAYERVLAAPRQHALYRNVPLAYMWDDHDFGPNNSDRTSPSRTASRLTYQEYVPHYPLAAGSGNVAIYQAFTAGRVRIIMTDCRSERTPYTASDNSAKTMLGAAQKAWFKAQLLDANGRFPVIVWVNTLPWIGTSGSDGWFTYATERREIANFIKANRIKGLVIISGDAHMLAIDDGRNSDYADGKGAPIPVFHAASMDAGGSVKGGPYSHGTIAGAGHFGLVTITDSGGASVGVRFSGRNESNRELMGLSMTFSATPQAPPFSVEYLWSGGVTNSSAVMCARVNREMAVRLLVATDDTFQNRVASERIEVRDAGSRVAKRRVNGLQANTAYSYGIVADGDTGRPTLVGHLRTLPAGIADFAIAFGSDAQTGSSHAVFDAIRFRMPLFLLHLGGFFYENIERNDASLYREAYRRTLTSAKQGALYRSSPIVYMWDDHDFGGAVSDASMPGKTAASTVYDEIVPHHTYAAVPGSSSPYVAFTAGRVRFILTDLRSLRSPAGAPDGPDKTMLGETQRLWLLEQLLDAMEAGMVVIWASTSPWLSTSAADGWHHYQWERGEIARFVRRHRIRHMLILEGGGLLAIDDGRRSDFAPGGGAPMTVFQAGTFDAPPAPSGADYALGSIAGRGQFGWLAATDRGDEITFQLSGRNASDEELIGTRIEVPTRPVISGVWTFCPNGATASIKAMVDGPATVRFSPRIRGVAEPIAEYVVRADRDVDFVASCVCTELEPATSYDCLIGASGPGGESQRTCRFRTPPVQRRYTFRAAFGSGAGTSSEHAVFGAIIRQEPLFMLHLGGFFSGSVEQDDVDAHLWQYERTALSSARSLLADQVPLVFFPGEDENSTGWLADAGVRSAARSAWLRVTPEWGAQESSAGAYGAYSVGRVRFVVLDVISFRTDADAPDGPEKTALGSKQLMWLEDECLRAAPSHPVIVLVSTMPWIDEKGDVGWGRYAFERRRICEFLSGRGIEGVVVVSGGLDMVGIDDGTNSAYGSGDGVGFPVLTCGSLDHHVRHVSGSYAIGSRRGTGFFGLLSVRDDGRVIEVTLEGRDARGALLFSHQFNRSVAAVDAGEEEPTYTDLVLEPVYPNPFSAHCTVSFALPRAEWVTVDVFDLLGRRVVRLVEGRLAPGRHSYHLSGVALPPGELVIRLTAGGRQLTRGVIRL